MDLSMIFFLFGIIWMNKLYTNKDLLITARIFQDRPWLPQGIAGIIFVKNLTQADFLENLICQEINGYWFSATYLICWLKLNTVKLHSLRIWK